MAGALCRRCGIILASTLISYGLDVHPTCPGGGSPGEEAGPVAQTNFAWGEPDLPPEADPLQPILTRMIRWADANAERSLQVKLGASELGNVCDRYIGYRVAGIPGVNHNRDPWPAIVGTGMHDWLEGAVNRYQSAHGTGDFITETRVQPDPMVQSRSDLYHVPSGSIIDYKGCGPTVMKKVVKDGPPEKYRIQLHVYGLGYANLGYEVKDVVLVFLPRAGWLRDMYVYREPYNKLIAASAISRMYRIAHELIDADIMSNPQRWNNIKATPVDCTWCPMYQPREMDRGADDKGCPGR